MRTTSHQAKAPSSQARNGPQSVGRVVLILEALSGVRDGATLSELAAEVGAPKTSLVGLLAGLTAERYLERDTFCCVLPFNWPMRGDKHFLKSPAISLMHHLPFHVPLSEKPRWRFLLKKSKLLKRNLERQLSGPMQPVSTG